MSLSETLLKNAVTTKLVVKAYRDAEAIHTKRFFISRKNMDAKQYDLIMKMVNRNGRLDDYMEYLKYEISNYDFKYNETVEFPLDIGAVLFMEYVLKDNDGDPYECEPTQFYIMLDPSIDSVKTITRRGSKSFTDKVVALRDATVNPGFKIQVTEQSMIVAREWLEDVYMWYYNSKLIQDWSGGLPLMKDSERQIKMKNWSSILVHTATNLEGLSGLGVHKQIYDEKSLYTADTARGRIVARGQKKKKGKRRVLFRTSGTPFGSGTDFHNDQVNIDKWQYFAPMICPMGYKKPVCYDCEYFTQTKYRKGEMSTLSSLECTAPLSFDSVGNPIFDNCYKRVPDDRYTIKELTDDFRDLGKTLWMQEFMCVTQDYTGNAIPLNLIHAIIDDNLEQHFSSDLPCYVGVDFGLSEKHRSAIVVVGYDEDNGTLVNLNTIILPAGTPYRTRDETTGDYRMGVVDNVINLFNNYPNIVKIVADATGVGKDYVERDMVDLCMKHHGFANVVPFKISGESKPRLWFGQVKPAMESGRIKTYMDRSLYLQMRAWRCEYDPTKQQSPRLVPPKAGDVQSDDALIAWFLALYGGLTVEDNKADAEIYVGGVDPHKLDGMSAFERASYGL